MNVRRTWIAATVAMFALVADSARAQCTGWDPGFAHFEFSRTSSNSNVVTEVVFDDGSGPALYVGGQFDAVGGVAATNVARWTGAQWSALGSGLAIAVTGLAVFDDGSGPALYAGGRFAGFVAKWDGSNWVSLGSGLSGDFSGATAMCVHDDGAGPALYVSGAFDTADGSRAIGIAKWDGSTWSALGSGLTHNGNSGYALALATFDDGSGQALIAAGGFDTAGGVPVDKVAKWNGAAWSAFGSGLDSNVSVLSVFDDGSGSTLYAGGTFTTAGGSSALGVARWSGSNWTPLACDFTNDGDVASVLDLEPFDDGSGMALYAAGVFTEACGSTAISVAKWDGATWSALVQQAAAPSFTVHDLCVFDDGSGRGARLWAAGNLIDLGAPHYRTHLGAWDGEQWTEPQSVGHGVDAPVSALAVYDDGSGAALYAGGDLFGATEALTPHVAKWTGDRWSALGDGLDAPVRALTVFDDGGGAALYAGGEFTSTTNTLLKRVARWDGSVWSDVGGGMNGSVFALSVIDLGSGPALYAGGLFSLAGGASAGSIAKWNGSSWSALGAGINGTVDAIAVFDDGLGGGPMLYAGGEFTMAGGAAATRIARWNGTSWSAIGSGIDGPVLSFEIFDEGSGPRLFVGGFFLVANGVNAFRIARWNGVAFSSVGASGVNGAVNAMRVFDDGSGAKLYVAGNFAAASGTPVNRFATWSGTSWASVDGGIGLNAAANALAIFDDASQEGPAVFVGGAFTTAGGKPSARIARWGSCRPGASYCSGDGLDPFLAAECPCGNDGAPGHGCANSNPALGGARLFASGTTHPNTIVLTCTSVPNGTLCTFVRASTSTPSGFVFGDGIKCLNGTGLRFGQQNAGQGINAPSTAASVTTTVASGNTRYYQVHYRNSNASFCLPATFNISNGYAIAW